MSYTTNSWIKFNKDNKEMILFVAFAMPTTFPCIIRIWIMTLALKNEEQSNTTLMYMVASSAGCVCAAVNLIW
jgi:hypothetical protein